MGSIPSDYDFGAFLSDDNIRTMEIFQQNPEAREIGRWYFVKKTRKTPKSRFRRTELPSNPEELKRLLENHPFIKQVQDDIYDYRVRAFGKMGAAKKSPEERQRVMEDIAKKYNLKIRFVPNRERGYEYKNGTGFFKQNNKLESLVSEQKPYIAAAFISIFLLLIGFLFSLSNLTGYVIGNSLNNSPNIAGLILLVAGLIVGIFYLKTL